jgi:uncharacterized sporulation protein YeaH/YhbH (DUF444 family)
LKIHIEIGDLILDGFDNKHSSTWHIREAIESDLAKLIAESRLANMSNLQNHDIDSVDVDSIDLSHDYGGSSSNMRVEEMVSASLAKSIYKSLDDAKK